MADTHTIRRTLAGAIRSRDHGLAHIARRDLANTAAGRDTEPFEPETAPDKPKRRRRSTATTTADPS